MRVTNESLDAVHTHTHTHTHNLIKSKKSIEGANLCVKSDARKGSIFVQKNNMIFNNNFTSKLNYNTRNNYNITCSNSCGINYTYRSNN